MGLFWRADIGSLQKKGKCRRIVKLLFHRNPDVAAAAEEALVSLGGEAVADLAALHNHRLTPDMELSGKPVTETVQRILIEIGSPAVPAAVAMLFSESNRIAMSGAVILGGIGPGASSAVEALIGVVEGERWEKLRAECALALGAAGDPSAVPPLILILQGDEYGCVRRAAAVALGELGDRRAFGPLEKACEFGYEEACAALEKIKETDR